MMLFGFCLVVGSLAVLWVLFWFIWVFFVLSFDMEFVFGVLSFEFCLVLAFVMAVGAFVGDCTREL